MQIGLVVHKIYELHGMLALQDAARPVALLLLLQKALQVSADLPVDPTKTAGQPLAQQEESWPAALANSVCHQVNM